MRQVVLAVRDILAAALARPRVLAVALALAIGVGLAGAAAGYVAAKTGLIYNIRTSAIDPMLRALRARLGKSESYAWETIRVNLGAIDLVRVPLFVDTNAAAPMAAIEELDGHLLFMRRDGQFMAMTPDFEMREIGLALNMNEDALRAVAIPGLDYTFFRTLDLLAIETAPHTFQLYASYHRFDAARRCFEVVVSNIDIAVTENGLSAQSGWSDVYKVNPCLPPRTEGKAFAGHQSGGRLVRQGDHILLSIGEFEYDGVHFPVRGSQAPDLDLGRIVRIDIATGRADGQLALGLRNPQGLAIDSEGRIWESEHGPRGGDEVNLIRTRGNYGWPIVTFGAQASETPEHWPLNPTPGGHAGYDLPSWVFVPSIGASQIIEPSPQAFPFWGSDMLLGSLRAGTLFVLHLEGDRIMYAEPIPLGDQIRDMINLANGDIAILSTYGTLILIRAHADEAAAPISVVYESAAPAAANAGEALFAARCGSCHSVTGQAGAGPPLDGVVGRDVAATAFSYSQALRDMSGQWSEDRLVRFIDDPVGAQPGTTMSDPFVTRPEARRIARYLRGIDQAPTGQAE
jgi:cytochrome c2